MCGIAGLLRPGGADDSLLSGTVKRMAQTLAHRGPDASGVWTQASSGIALGHRRLSILDLSEAGAQPMRSDCGRFAVTFNGEIYNHLDIRSDLEAENAAPNWRGHSDTETLLYAVRHWGIAAALQRLSGMFAFALWDARERTLTLTLARLAAGDAQAWLDPAQPSLLMIGAAFAERAGAKPAAWAAKETGRRAAA